jgi:hypothetical protein
MRPRGSCPAAVRVLHKPLGTAVGACKRMPAGTLYRAKVWSDCVTYTSCLLW